MFFTYAHEIDKYKQTVWLTEFGDDSFAIGPVWVLHNKYFKEYNSQNSLFNYTISCRRVLRRAAKLWKQRLKFSCKKMFAGSISAAHCANLLLFVGSRRSVFCQLGCATFEF